MLDVHIPHRNGGLEAPHPVWDVHMQHRPCTSRPSPPYNAIRTITPAVADKSGGDRVLSFFSIDHQ